MSQRNFPLRMSRRQATTAFTLPIRVPVPTSRPTLAHDLYGAEMEHTRSEVRSLATQKRLIDVTIRILAESGHARATIQRICDEAGVSNGGVFRHFSSRDELLIRVGQELASRIQEAFVTGRQSNFDHVEGEHPLLPLLRETRRVSRSETGLAWREILLAARYSDKLVESLRPAIERMRVITLRYACDLTGLPATDPSAQRLAMVLMTAVHVFNSEACFDFHPSTEGDELRLAWIAETLAIEVARAVANVPPTTSRDS